MSARFTHEELLKLFEHYESVKLIRTGSRSKYLVCVDFTYLRSIIPQLLAIQKEVEHDTELQMQKSVFCLLILHTQTINNTKSIVLTKGQAYALFFAVWLLRCPSKKGRQAKTERSIKNEHDQMNTHLHQVKDYIQKYFVVTHHGLDIIFENPLVNWPALKTFDGNINWVSLTALLKKLTPEVIKDEKNRRRNDEYRSESESSSEEALASMKRLKFSDSSSESSPVQSPGDSCTDLPATTHELVPLEQYEYQTGQIYAEMTLHQRLESDTLTPVIQYPAPMSQPQPYFDEEEWLHQAINSVMPVLLTRPHLIARYQSRLDALCAVSSQLQHWQHASHYDLPSNTNVINTPYYLPSNTSGTDTPHYPPSNTNVIPQFRVQPDAAEPEEYQENEEELVGFFPLDDKQNEYHDM